MRKALFYPHPAPSGEPRGPYEAKVLLEHADGTANLEVAIPDRAPFTVGGVPHGDREPGTWAPVKEERPARQLLAPTIAEVVSSQTVPPAQRSHAQRQSVPPPAPAREEAQQDDGPTATILAAVKDHPMLMSATLLGSLLRGEMLGRLEEKGLAGSQYFGALADAPCVSVTEAIHAAMERKWLARTSGLYPALYVTPAGLARSVEQTASVVSPDEAFKLYYAWRLAKANGQRTHPYRIVDGALLNRLARLQPSTLEQLLAIPGLGKTRALRYQQELLAIGQQLATAKDVAHG